MAQPAEDFANGVAALERGDLELAASLLGGIPVGDAYHFPRALPHLGRLYAKLGDAELAKDFFRRAADHLRTGDAYYELSDFLISIGNTLEAQAHLLEAIKRDPKFTDAYIRLGIIHHQNQQHAEAIRWLEAAILLDAKALVARYYLAQSCLAVGNKQRAISQLHFVLHVKPDYGPARLLRADIFQGMGDHRQALVEFCDLADDGNRDPSLYLRMGKSFQALGDKRQAMFALEQAFRLQPTLVAVGAEAARMREEEGHLRTALDLYRMLYKSDKKRPATAEAIARIEERLGIVHVSEDEAAPVAQSDPTVRFEAPQVQLESTPTAPLPLIARDLKTGRLTEPRKRTEPLRSKTAPMPAPEAPTVMGNFFNGMFDFLKDRLPDPVRHGVEQIRQKVDFEAQKLRRKP